LDDLNNRNDYILTNQKTLIYVGYPYGYPLDSYVVLSPTRGVVGVDRFWVQPFEEGSSGFIQPVRLAAAH
jgi:hypothetical protein